MDYDGFVRAVAARADISRPEAAVVTPGEARNGARAVFLTLRDAVTGGEFKDMLSQLPKEFAELAEG